MFMERRGFREGVVRGRLTFPRPSLEYEPALMMTRGGGGLEEM